LQVVDFVSGKPSKTLVQVLGYEELEAPVDVTTTELVHQALYPATWAASHAPPSSSVLSTTAPIASTVRTYNTNTVTTVLLSPVTGRTHQLRMHTAAIGHPILGDSLYAPQSVIKLPLNGRLCLHANSMTIRHPVTGEMLTVSTNGVDFDAPVLTITQLENYVSHQQAYGYGDGASSSQSVRDQKVGSEEGDCSEGCLDKEVASNNNDGVVLTETDDAQPPLKIAKTAV
jgi:hypothetical protein